MKKIFTVLMLLLALNFLAVAGGVGWLWNSRHLDRDKVSAIKKILFPAPATQPVDVAAVPAPTTAPTLRLEELLASQSGHHSAGEQVEFIQQTFDAQMAQLDRRQRELEDLKRQTDLAQEKLTRDHAAEEANRAALAAREKQVDTLAGDKGFQDSLMLYNTMPSKQVKKVFVGLDDATIMNYLRAMQPRTAAKIIKEFQTPEETARIQKILESMRQAQPATEPSQPSTGSPTAAAVP